jgi:hypothetical protein
VDLHLLLRPGETGAPLIFKHKDNPAVNRYYNLVPWLAESKTPFYLFAPGRCAEDIPHIEAAAALPNGRIFRFATDRHGVPFHTFSLPDIVNRDPEGLDRLHRGFRGGEIGSIAFSVKASGAVKTATQISRLAARKLVRNG